jgi:hypothetical protein
VFGAAQILEEQHALFFHLQQQRLIELIRIGKTEEALAFAQEYLAPHGEENEAFLEELGKGTCTAWAGVVMVFGGFCLLYWALLPSRAHSHSKCICQQEGCHGWHSTFAAAPQPRCVIMYTTQSLHTAATPEDQQPLLSDRASPAVAAPLHKFVSLRTSWLTVALLKTPRPAQWHWL